MDKIDLKNHECDNELIYNNIEQIEQFYDNSEVTYTLQKPPEIMWKKIKNDGNCFYRAILFSFLENLIFKNDINFLKNFICDFKFLLTERLNLSLL